jgi:hypothetical protein
VRGAELSSRWTYDLGMSSPYYAPDYLDRSRHRTLGGGAPERVLAWWAAFATMPLLGILGVLLGWPLWLEISLFLGPSWRLATVTPVYVPLAFRAWREQRRTVP